MAPQPPIHPWRRPLFRGLGPRSSVTGSVFPTDMGYIGASGFASEKYFCRTEPAPERRALFMGVARPCSAERASPRMALTVAARGHPTVPGTPNSSGDTILGFSELGMVSPELPRLGSSPIGLYRTYAAILRWGRIALPAHRGAGSSPLTRDTRTAPRQHRERVAPSTTSMAPRRRRNWECAPGR